MRRDRGDWDAPPDVPTWAVAVGAVLVLLFAGLSANAYFGATSSDASGHCDRPTSQ